MLATEQFMINTRQRTVRHAYHALTVHAPHRQGTVWHGAAPQKGSTRVTFFTSCMGWAVARMYQRGLPQETQLKSELGRRPRLGPGH